MRSFVYALCLAVLPSAAAESTAVAVFPALRKRLAEKKLAATQIKAEPAEQDAGPVMPAVVPAAVDAGADGFPTLPSVSNMLSDASVSLKAVSSQASSLEARVVQAQMQSESKMAKQKAAFDEKLKEQEQGNRGVIKANDGIAETIKTLKADNAGLKKHAHQIEESNKAMRAELHTLQSHLGEAKDFTAKSLTSTDDSKSALLQVLHKSAHQTLVETSQKTKTKKGDDSDDGSDDSDDEGSDDQDDSDDSADSFLQVRREDGTASLDAAMTEMDAVAPPVSAMNLDAGATSDPGDLLTILSKDVAHLAQQEKESEKTLKSLFIRDFRAGAKRHAALLLKQKGLTANSNALQQTKAQLTKAVEHLETTNKQLAGRLHGLGQYLQKLAHFAMAPQKEVKHLIEVLPKTVTVKTEKAPIV